MKWYERSEWSAFTAAVLKNPADDTARLVAADWLDEQDDPTAEARARLIRDQCGGRRAHFGEPYLPLRPGWYADDGLVEPAYQKTTALVVDRGWPVWAVFLPQCFNEHNVIPVFKLAPLTTCSTAGMCALSSHETLSPNSRTHDVYIFEDGPEDLGGFVHSQADLSQHFSPAQFNHLLARLGRNLHAEVYRQPGYLPYPIHNCLPVEGGAGGTRHLQRRTRYRSLFGGCEAAMKAAWLCGRKWAKLSSRVANKGVNPEAFAVWTVAFNTLANAQREEAGEFQSAPSANTDPFVMLREAFQTARQMPKKQGRPLIDVLNGTAISPHGLLIADDQSDG